MTFIKKITTVLFAVSLAACGTMQHGTKIDDTQLSTLQKGKTTYTDVVTKFGTPNNVTTTSDGSRNAIYVYRTEGSHYFGRPNITSNTTSFMFSPNGTLRDYSSSQSTTQSTTPQPKSPNTDPG